MIDHDDARALAAAALDFDLSVEDDQRLLAHMIGCEECRAFAEALDVDARAIGGLVSEDAPAGLRARILDAVPAAAAAEPAPDLFVAAMPRPPRPHGAFGSIPRRYRGPLAISAAATIAVALIGGTLVWRPSLSGAPIAGGASASPIGPVGSGAPGSSRDPASPVPTVEPGSRLAASPWTQVADLTADDAATGVVGVASGFVLRMLDGTPANEAAKRLTVQPPIAFRIDPDADGKTVRITPTEPLTPGAAYRFSLAAADGHEVGTWAFQAHRPLRVIGTVPGDQESGVPRDTGIEVAFDQDGVVDAESHVSISPSVDGRFEQHGRTLAFVPASPLSPATIYTVTVSPGVAVGATDQRLEEGFTFRFETAADGPAGGSPTFQFSDELFESSTSDRPIVALWAFQSNEDEENPVPPPTSAPLEIYRIDGLDAAIDAYRDIRAFPRWSRHTSTSLISTTGLTQVLTLDARLQDSDGVLWTELPERLSAGWYLIHLPSPTRPIQAMLQVTDIASYLVVSDTKTLVWVNDLATRAALPGAAIAASGTDLGRTGADGTLVTTTLAALRPEPQGTCALPCVALITVRDGDRSAFVPASEPSDAEGKDIGWGQGQDDSLRYWHAFYTDRSLYRSTDTVNAWGVVRDRDSGNVPDEVTIALTADDVDGGAGPALVTKTVKPNATGAFTSSIAIDALPMGSYGLEMRAGDRVIASTEFQVDRILKPAYRLDVTTGRRVYVVGDTIRVTAHATFYEGTPVPGIALRTDGVIDGTFTTDQTGTASRRTTARIRDRGEDELGPEVQSISVAPAGAEEGEITASSREVVVFPSLWTIGGTATNRDGRVRVNATLSRIARDRLERQVAAGEDPWSLDPAGAPIPGRTVSLTFSDIITNRQPTGTRYDFIERKVVPTYGYSTSEHVVETIRVKTDSKGRFTASIPAADGHAYRVRATVKDTDGHTARWIESVGDPGDEESTDRGPMLTLTDDPDATDRTFGVGDVIDLQMTDPTAAGEGASDRYLFTTAQRGLREVVVQDSSRFRTTFGRSAPPGLRIDAVRFNGSRYSATTTFQASFRTSDRALTVNLSTDRARYAPGADARLEVTTRDRSGDPVAATVVLRAVDEKLTTLGGAVAADPLADLYGFVDAGIRVVYRSHHPPRGGPFEGGDTTGGGRDDFRDTILFRSVETGADGHASVTMRLSDDLTSWRVSASAIGARLSAGEGSILVPVGLPFFVDATIAPEYLVSDRPEIGLRAFGSALDPTSRVRFGVDSDSLGLHVSGLTADAFETKHVRLPALALGRHVVTITARTGTGASARVDRLTRTFTVIGSRLERTRTTYRELTGPSHIEGGGGLTEVTVSDAGVGRYAPLTIGIADTGSARLENALAASLAGSLAQSRFAASGTGVDPFDGDAYQTPDGGLSLVPYASSDVEASVLAALVGPQGFDTAGLRSYLATVAGDPKETRERRNFALAGLAGLRASVLPELRGAAADPDLTIRERLLLGIGAAALGDATTAHAIAAVLTEGYGEAIGDQARLRVGSHVADTSQATALMAMLAAANDDPLAPRFWAYVEANPDEDATYALHAAGFAQAMETHAPATPASFAYVVDRERHVVHLDPGATFRLIVTEQQVATLTLEPLEGDIAIVTSWQEPVVVESLERDPDITIERLVEPAGAIGSDDLVRVTLDVSVDASAPAGCHPVVETVPSGLVAVGNLQGWITDEEGETQQRAMSLPYRRSGQRLEFCYSGAPLWYVARVVTRGTYTWEPAIVASRTGPDRAAWTASASIEIR
ncbi:MAG TPA: Ig-like domain-containing protein [Candidatus Limnocylindrales bacterium]